MDQGSTLHSFGKGKDGRLSGLKDVRFALPTEFLIFKTGKLKSAFRLFYVHIQKWPINSMLNFKL